MIEFRYLPIEIEGLCFMLGMNELANFWMDTLFFVVIYCVERMTTKEQVMLLVVTFPETEKPKLRFSCHPY